MTEELQQTQTESFVEKLVAARGPQWKDPEVIAKGKLEADTYVASLENQIKELREDLSKQDYSKSLLDALQNKATPSTTVAVAPNTNNSGTEPADTKPAVSEDILKRLVEETITKKELERTEAENKRIVADKLVKDYGTNADEVVNKKAQSLGINPARLQELAAESPSAFFALVGEKDKPYVPMVTGTINTSSASQQTTSDRNWAYYQNLRKSNKTLYYEPKTQRQMMDDRVRLGDKFGL